MRYAIIGCSTAGNAAVEAIRSVDNTGSITVISDEKHNPYSRPLITYWLAGKVDDKRMHYKGKDFFKKHKVKALLGKKAVSVDANKREVKLEDGVRIPYDRLLIATGGSPIKPPIKGSELSGVFSFTRWDDAISVKDFIKKNNASDVVVVGGGLIGLKTTEALVDLGLNVTVLELADRVLSATFDVRASDVLMDYLRDKGVSILTGNTVEEIQGSGGRVSGVVLRDGRTLSCGMVVLAIGVKPNVALVDGAGVEVGRGIVVDERMESSVADVYAAGDVVEARDNSIDSSRTIAIWPLAVRQGRIAGLNMAGADAKYPGGFPMNSVEIHGLPTISVGVTDPQDKGYSVIKEYKPEEHVYKKIVLKDGVIRGVIFVGKVDRAGLFTGLIESGMDVSKIKEHLLNEDFGLITLPRDFRKHVVSGPGVEV